MSELLVPRQQPVPAVVPLLLSFTAGFVDSCTVLALFGLFVAQVTGSFVLAAVAFVTHEQGAATKVLAIPVFLLAAVATTALAVIVESRGRSALTWSLGLECAALTAFLIAAFAGAPLSDPNAATVVAASLLGLFARHPKRNGAAPHEECGLDQCDDYEYNPDCHRRDRALPGLASAPDPQ
jgi:uncharacterized membrane protein YoaK (UPF0700 family)